MILQENKSIFDTTLWKTPRNPKRFSTDELFLHFQNIIDKNKNIVLSVGTDSQHLGKMFKFVTVFCGYNPGKGGQFFYCSELKEVKTYSISNQKLRMFDEVARSIELAQITENTLGKKPNIHIDASPKDKNEFTSSFVEQLEGYVIGSGFECVIKPNSYTSSFIADKFSKKL